MAKLKLESVKASTLMEVIVAMVVIMVVFALATGIYTGIVRSSPSFRQQEIKAKTDNVIAQSVVDQNWEDEVLQSDSLELQKTVVPYENSEDLLLITVKAVERGTEIGLSRRVVKHAVDGRSINVDEARDKGADGSLLKKGGRNGN